jgi:hypothetical protein
VDAQHLQAANLIWHTDVNLAIKPAKPPQRSVNAAKEAKMRPQLQDLMNCNTAVCCGAIMQQYPLLLSIQSIAS